MEEDPPMKRSRTSQRGVQEIGGGLYRIRGAKIDPKTGRRREIDRRVRARSVVEAARIRLQILDELARAPEQRPLLKLGDFADAWLVEVSKRMHDEDPKQLHLCNATRVRYEGSVETFIKPFLGDYYVDQITARDVKDWRAHLLEHGYRRSTINGHLRVLKTILRAAGNEAATKVSTLNEKVDARTTRKEPNLLTAEELDRFLSIAARDWPQYYALILVLFTTTMRLSTALALRRDDVDLESMEFVVRRRLSMGMETPGVKRDRFGEDAPPLLPAVHEALKAHWATFNAAQSRSGLMFPSSEGTYHSRSALQRPFADILTKAGITKRFTPHGCRRTGAKLYGKTAGTRMAMEISGHLTEEMHRHYAPALAEEKLAAASSTFGGLRLLAGGVDFSKTKT
jgi:integrase